MKCSKKWALKESRGVIFFFWILSSAFAADPLTTFTIQNPSLSPTEVVVQFKYSVRCQKQSTEDQIRGYVSYQGRRTVVDFYTYRNEVEIALGEGSRDPEEAVLEIDPSSSCRLEDLQGQVQYEDVTITGQESPRALMEKLALIHSPFINFRENQYDRSPNDTPLVLAYSVIRGAKNRVHGLLDYNKILRYTIFLSDEDNQKNSSDTNAQMARYGRTTDIEWCYDVELDADLNVVSESYQGALHFPYTFRGNYLKAATRVSSSSEYSQSFHPILFNYNLDDNNVFVDTTEAWIDHFRNPKQKTRRTGHHLVPRIRIDNPESRERVMFANPWTFKVSEAELNRQNKAAFSPKDQLFVLVRGEMTGGSFLGEITSSQGEVFLSGGSPCNSWRCNVAELGTDLWGKEGFTAIPVTDSRLNSIGTPLFSGEFRLRDSLLLGLKLKGLRFFRLRDLGQTYGVEELTSYFQCNYSDVQTVCRF